MKYFPLVWAALRRKPVRAIVTLLSVTIAFTLFGLMIGLNATFDQVEQRARADQIDAGGMSKSLRKMILSESYNRKNGKEQ